MIGLNGGLVGKPRRSIYTNNGIWTPSEQVLSRFDPYWDDVAILLHMDGTNGSTTFIDSSKYNATITVNNQAQISTVQSKFGGASALFDGTTDSITAPSNATAFTCYEDFTIEFWMYVVTNDSNAGIISNGAGSLSGTAFTIIANHTTQTNRVSIWNAPSSSSALCSTGTYSTATWHHVAFVRSEGTLTPYLDGVAGTSVANTSVWTLSATNFRVGRYWNGDFNGHIDEVRVTKNRARYTANFTPPGGAFPNA